MGIKFKCDVCGTAYEQPESAAGRKAVCRCGASMVVPQQASALEIDDLAAIASAQHQAPPQPTPQAAPPISQQPFAGGQGFSGAQIQPKNQQGQPQNQQEQLPSGQQTKTADAKNSSLVLWVTSGIGLVVVIVAVVMVLVVLQDDEPVAKPQSANNGNTFAQDSPSVSQPPPVSPLATATDEEIAAMDAILQPGALFMVAADIRGSGLTTGVRNEMTSQIESYRQRVYTEIEAAGIAAGVRPEKYSLLLFEESGREALVRAEPEFRRAILPLLTMENVENINQSWEDFPYWKNMEPQVEIRLGFLIYWPAEPATLEERGGPAPSMLQFFAENPETATRLYSKAGVQIDGKIVRFGVDEEKQPYMEVRPTAEMDLVMVYAAGDQLPWVSFGPGQQIEVTGFARAEMSADGALDHVVMERCRVQQQSKNPVLDFTAKSLATRFLMSPSVFTYEHWSKWAQVTGTVLSTTSNDDGEFVMLQSNHFDVEIRCKLQPLSAGWAEQAKEGTEVTLLGMIETSDREENFVQLADCLPISGMELPR